ncbi:Glutamyl-tRNA reductase-binding protein [Arachis hypogaea]|nr:Glutamyl-tRNA reductase-binding protein [Arachis hypogaea]
MLLHSSVPFTPNSKTSRTHFHFSNFSSFKPPKCSLSVVSEAPHFELSTHSNKKPFPAEVSRTIMELATVGTLSALTNEGHEGKQNLDAARKCLLASLETSSAIGSALDESESRLELLRQRCQSLQTSFRPISMQKCSFMDVGNGIDSVLCSAAAVLKVFEFVQHLENSLLTDPGSDLCSYVSDAKKLEEALKLLTDNCTLAIGWLQGVLDFLQDKAITNEFYLFQVKKSLRILRELQAVEEGVPINGGFLSAALDNLETEFQRLLMANSMPIPLVSLGSHVATQALPGSVMGKLQAIIERLNANSRLAKFESIYVEVRGTNAQRTLNTLDLSYLEIPTAKFEDVREIASYIDQWGIDLEFVVKNVLHTEYMLSCRVFEKIGREASTECFARIAIRSGILSFILCFIPSTGASEAAKAKFSSPR